MTLVKKSNPRQAASILKELSRDPSEGDTNMITLTSHLEEGLPEDEQRRRILRYFSAVSQEYLPLDIEKLPVKVKDSIHNVSIPESIPFLDHVSIMESLKNLKKTFSQIPGEMPAALRGEFFQWLTEPFKNILIEIVRTGVWPAVWKIEYGTPIPKEPLPIEGEDGLRVISITKTSSMTAE